MRSNKPIEPDLRKRASPTRSAAHGNVMPTENLQEMPMPYDATPDLLDRNLVLDFFWKFSVFECALKREGFLHAGRYDAAKPDWHRFGESILGRFGEVRDVVFREALRTLTASSPRRQIVRDGRLAWE